MDEEIIKNHARLTEKQLAQYWGIKVGTLRKWRCLKTGPAFIKIGGKPIYPRDWVLEYERNRSFYGSGERVYPKGATDGEK